MSKLFIPVFWQVTGIFRALDKREYLVVIRENFCKFCIKTFVVTPHLMRGHNIWFHLEIRRIINKYSLLSRTLCIINEAQSNAPFHYNAMSRDS